MALIFIRETRREVCSSQSNMEREIRELDCQEKQIAMEQAKHQAFRIEAEPEHLPKGERQQGLRWAQHKMLDKRQRQQQEDHGGHPVSMHQEEEQVACNNKKKMTTREERS